jgi:hypothetical protein
MSRLHFSAFIDDLKSINPRFNTSTSSLNGLVTYLDRTVQRPSVFSTNKNEAVKQALKFCTNPSNPKSQKYLPAIERLVQVWGMGHKAYPLGKRLQKVDIKRICFRGDDRPPQEIFAGGFSKRRDGAEAEYVGNKVVQLADTDPTIGNILGLTKTGDIDSPTAVCVSPNFNAAALFPLPKDRWDNDITFKNSYIYLVYLKSGYNTNLRQAMDFLEGITQLRELESNETAFATNAAKIEAHRNRVKAIGQVLYGQEMAADAIDKSHIFAAIEVQRTWKSVKKVVNGSGQRRLVTDFKEGGNFRVIDVKRNPAAKYPDGFEVVVNQFLNGLQGQGGTMSVIEDGFTNSLRN